MRARTKKAENGIQASERLRGISPLFDDGMVERLTRIVDYGKNPYEDKPNPHNTLQMLERLLGALEQGELLTQELVETMIRNFECHEYDLYDAIRRQAISSAGSW